MFSRRSLINNKIPLLLLLLFIGYQARAQQKFTVAYYHDAEQTQITGPVSRLNFTPIIRPHQLNPLANRGVYLFRILLSAPPAAGGNILQIVNEHLDSIFLYRRESERLVLAAVAGNDIRNQLTIRGYPQFVLYGKGREYYVKINFKKDVLFEPLITPLPQLLDQTYELYLRVGAYYGFAIVVFLINLFLFQTFKERIFIYYSLFQLSIFLSIFSSDGLFPFLTENRFILNNADLPLHLAIAVSGFLFSGSFMEAQNRYIYKKWVLVAATVLIIAADVINLIFDNYAALLAGDVIVFSMLLSYWVIGIIRFRKHRFSRYFVFAYGIYLLFAIDYYLARKFGIFTFNFIGGQLKIGSFAEMIVLSLAIIYRVNELRKENEHYRETIEKYMQEAELMQSKSDQQWKSTLINAQKKYKLSDREMDVLTGITEGLTNNELADKLFVSLNTIKYHTKNIFDKMEITNRSQAISRINQKEPVRTR